MCSWRVSRTRHSCVTGARRGPARSHAGPARTGDTLLPGHKRALLRETAGGVAAPGGGQTGPYKATGAPVEAHPEAAGSPGASATAEPPASRASVSRSWRHCAFVSVLCRNCDGLNATKRRAQLVRRLKARGWSLLCLPPTACSLPTGSLRPPRTEGHAKKRVTRAPEEKVASRGEPPEGTGGPRG